MGIITKNPLTVWGERTDEGIKVGAVEIGSRACVLREVTCEALWFHVEGSVRVRVLNYVQVSLAGAALTGAQVIPCRK